MANKRSAAWVGIGGLIAVSVLVLVFRQALSPVTDPRAYVRQLQTWPTRLVQEFPSAVPAHATGVRFYASGGGLGPGRVMMVRFIVPPEEAAAAVARAAAAESREVPMADRGDAVYPPNFSSEGQNHDTWFSYSKGFNFHRLGVDHSREEYAYFAGNATTGELVYWITSH